MHLLASGTDIRDIQM